MKKLFLGYAAAALAAMSCSSMASLQTQVYDDGIYNRPSVAEVPAGNMYDEEVDVLLAQSKESPVYIVSEGDTLVVPAGKSVRFGDSAITIVATLVSMIRGRYRIR